jgi:hypothetical protein
LEDINKRKNELIINSSTDRLFIDSAKWQMELFHNQSSSLSEPQDIESKFKNEGIIRKIGKKGKIMEKLYRVFCDSYFNTNQTAIDHLNRSFHETTKRGENLKPVDDKFTIKTQRINEFEVCFARMKALYSLKTDLKVKYFEKGIRLKDGIGSSAYVCLKCNVFISSETVESGMFSFINHINSQLHKNNDCMKSENV